jgi:LCP family protein required for cell wall assembly
MLLLALVILVGLYYVGSAAFAVATIAQNVRDMRVPTPPLVTIAPLEPSPAAQAGPPIISATPVAVVPALLAATPAATLAVPAVDPAPVGAEPPPLPTGGPLAAPAPAGWPTAVPLPLATATPTPIPLGGEAALAQPTAAGWAPPLGLAQPAAGGPVNVLLLGLDRRPGEGGPARMDAIIVARLDPERRRVALLSLPRDLVVNIPGVGPGRINAASVYGEMYPALGGGAASARNTVSQLLGVPIDYVVHIDFEGFIKAVDAIGGVTVDVPRELYDPQYPTMDYGYTTVHFLPGPQHMDGETALTYARVRHMDSDFERANRQQQVIVAAVSQLRGQSALQQLNSAASISSALRGYLAFDIPEDRLVALVWAFRDITPEQVERYSLGGGQVLIGAPGDPYAVFAAPGALEGLVARLLGQ